MPKVKTTYTYKTQSIVKKFSDEFMESINNQLYCNLCNCVVSCNKRFLVDSHRNTSKHKKALGCRSEILIPPRLHNRFYGAVTPILLKR